jgi:uncharacterized OsmC-like protein
MRVRYAVAAMNERAEIYRFVGRRLLHLVDRVAPDEIPRDFPRWFPRCPRILSPCRSRTGIRNSNQGDDEMNIHSKVDNGVNVTALLGAREALEQAPEAARFEWRATCDWINGTHSRSMVEGFGGLGGEQMHRTRFTFDADHPEVFAAEDNGATPVEYVLVGLASCLTAGVAAVAQHREIQLRSVRAEIAGNMDIRGILGMDADVRNGFDDVTVTFVIDADASREEIEALVAQSQKRSAVYDLLVNPTSVAVEVK